MKFLVVVTPRSIYHGFSTWKTFWEEKFTCKQDLFESVNMKNCGRLKVRKHKKIKGSDKCVTLNIYESLNISLALKTKARSKNTKRQGMPSEMSA